jgi:hypothetical protein
MADAGNALSCYSSIPWHFHKIIHIHASKFFFGNKRKIET